MKVTLNDDGKKTEYETSTDTVEEFLDAKAISYNSYDLITPSLEEVITEGMEITITRCERILTEVEEEIPYTTEEHLNAELPKNIVSITRYGEKGVRTKIVETIKFKGKVISEAVVSNVVNNDTYIRSCFSNSEISFSANAC